MENVPIKHVLEDYMWKTDRMIKERITHHNKHDKNSHILKQSHEKGHTHVWDKHFKVLGNTSRSAFKQKISEALFIKE